MELDKLHVGSTKRTAAERLHKQRCRNEAVTVYIYMHIMCKTGQYNGDVR